jgi:large subunit ribosomal protein L21
MYAIVRTGGKQYRVERGQRLLIERLAAKEGADVSLEPLLYRSEEAVLDKAGLEQVQVTAKVIEHVRGPKLRVFKFKPKRGYRRRTGHRQELTRIEVTEISGEKRRASRAGAGAGEAPATAKDGAAKPRATQKVAAKPARAAKDAAAAGAGKPAAKPAAKPARAPKSAAGAEGAGKAAAKPARSSKGAEDAQASAKAGEKPAPAAKPSEDSDGS